MLQTMLQTAMTKRPPIHLTSREVQVLELLCEGRTPKEIAGQLDRSYWTIQSHLGSARRRNQANTNEQLVSRYRTDRRRFAPIG